jgi:cytoskeletal protein CcmA (bactofilin family)
MFSKGSRGGNGNGQYRAPDKPVAPSIISTDLKIIGDLFSEGEIQIDGIVEGDIRSKTLLVGEPASVKGDIVAETVRVFGTVTGQIKAISVSLTKSAHVTGDIIHHDLAIEKGAFLEGHCKRMTDKAVVGDMKIFAAPNSEERKVKPIEEAAASGARRPAASDSPKVAEGS